MRGLQNRLKRLTDLRDAHREKSWQDSPRGKELDLWFRAHARASGEDIPINEEEARLFYKCDLEVVACSGDGYEITKYLAYHVEYGEQPRNDAEAQHIFMNNGRRRATALRGVKGWRPIDGLRFTMRCEGLMMRGEVAEAVLSLVLNPFITALTVSVDGEMCPR